MSRSLYSPSFLERSDRFGEEGAKGRDAFDDLISVQEGRPMSRPDAPHPQSCLDRWAKAIDPDKLSEIADQWAAILGFEAHGKLESSGREIMARLFRPENDVAEDAYANEDYQGDFDDDNDDDNDDEDVHDNDAYDDDEAITEQDWYMRLLKDDPTSLSAPLMKAMARQAFRNELGNGTENTNTTTDVSCEGPKPGITSTLTTTQRTTLPDGTVHTKLVLKRRFADGREESAETTHTTHGRREQQLKQVLEPTAEMSQAVKQDEAEKPKEKKKAGWFWN